jgi:hypothetical protein
MRSAAGCLFDAEREMAHDGKGVRALFVPTLIVIRTHCSFGEYHTLHNSTAYASVFIYLTIYVTTENETLFDT